MYAHPYIIGIAGNSGSGKSTIAKAILDVFTQDNTTVLCGDDMHKWERNDPNWNKYTHLNPNANNLELELKLLRTLSKGKTISRNFYDHHTGTFTQPKLVEPTNLVILEGLHAFFLEKIREIYKMLIFIKPAPKLNQDWKIKRDTKERHKNKEKILAEIKNRENDFKDYIATQEQYANIKIEFLYKKTQDLKSLEVKSNYPTADIYMLISLFNQPKIDSIVKTLESDSKLKINYFYQENFQTFKAHGKVTIEEIKKLSDKVLPELKLFDKLNPNWHSGYIGIIQIIISYLLLRNGLKI